MVIELASVVPRGRAVGRLPEKLWPVIVTDVPPAVVPEMTFNPVTLGVRSTT